MSTSYTAEIHHQGQTHTITVAENETVLAAAQNAGLELPTSCGAGVCTTCAALLLEGTVDQSDGMGISPELIQQGYALLCVAHPRSNLKIETEKEEIVYQKQFGEAQSR
jgi:ferredoxin